MNLVGGLNPFETYARQLRWVFPIYGKSESSHVPNHQPVESVHFEKLDRHECIQGMCTPQVQFCFIVLCGFSLEEFWQKQWQPKHSLVTFGWKQNPIAVPLLYPEHSESLSHNKPCLSGISSSPALHDSRRDQLFDWRIRSIRYLVVTARTISKTS